MSNHAAGSIFPGDSAMAARCRAFDWGSTKLGPVESWSPTLQVTVGIVLMSKNPMFLFWGPQFVQIYNDAYAPSLGQGGRHPRALGAEGQQQDDKRDLPPGAFLVLEVEDEGTGMHESTMAQMFEPFFTTKDPGKGTGLGLATVYGIMQQSGGHVFAESTPGKGSTFHMYLPRVMSEVEPVSVTPIEECASVGAETVCWRPGAGARRWPSRRPTRTPSTSS